MYKNLTSSIPATCSEIPTIRPIQRITPKSGGSFTSTIDPTSSSPSSPVSPSSPKASQLSGDLNGEGGPCTPLVRCEWSVEAGDVGLRGFGGGRGGGSRGLLVGFGGGSGGCLSACLVGGSKATLGAETGGDEGPGFVTGGITGFRMDLGIWRGGL